MMLKIIKAFPKEGSGGGLEGIKYDRANIRF